MIRINIYKDGKTGEAIEWVSEWKKKCYDYEKTRQRVDTGEQSIRKGREVLN